MKTVLITGSTSGIGLGIAKEFAKEKYNIIFNGLEPDGPQIAENIGNTGIAGVGEQVSHDQG